MMIMCFPGMLPSRLLGSGPHINVKQFEFRNLQDKQLVLQCSKIWLVPLRRNSRFGLLLLGSFSLFAIICTPLSRSLFQAFTDNNGPVLDKKIHLRKERVVGYGECHVLHRDKRLRISFRQAYLSFIEKG
jgi:hypothetical protein